MQKMWIVKGGKIEQVSHLKYLGVTFSHNLGWKAYIRSAAETGKINSNALLRFYYSSGCQYVLVAITSLKC